MSPARLRQVKLYANGTELARQQSGRRFLRLYLLSVEKLRADIDNVGITLDRISRRA